jgi:hypothetical protein
VRKGAELVAVLPDRDPLMVAFGVADARARFEARAQREAGDARDERGRRLAVLADFERTAHRSVGRRGQRVRVVDRFPRAIYFAAGHGAVWSDAQAPSVADDVPPEVATAVWNAHRSAATADWLARAREVEATQAHARDHLLELVQRLRDHRLVYSEIAEFLRAADMRFNAEAPGPILRDYVNDDRTWRTHGPGGRQLLADAIRQTISRARISVTAAR